MEEEGGGRREEGGGSGELGEGRSDVVTFLKYAGDNFGHVPDAKGKRKCWETEDQEDMGRFKAWKRQIHCDSRACKRVLVVKAGHWQSVKRLMGITANIGLPWLMVLLVSCASASFVPICRWAQGSDAFPDVIWVQMAWNSANQAVFLLIFLGLFESETQRLSVISTALRDFECKTLAPKMSSDDQALRDPFALYVDVDDDYQVKESSSMEKWRRRWVQVGLNVENWSTCSMIMRVLVSTARVTSQVVLLLAALLLSSLLFLSVAEAMSGPGAEPSQDALSGAEVKGLVQEAVDDGQARAGDAMRRLSEAGAVGRAAAAAVGPGGPSGAPLTPAALVGLAECFRPLREELKGPLRAQLAALAAGHRRLEAVVKDVATPKATMTHALTLFFFAVLAIYVIRLLMHIAGINTRIMKQESVLLEKQKMHRMLQLSRELAVDRSTEPEGVEEEETPTSVQNDELSRWATMAASRRASAACRISMSRTSSEAQSVEGENDEEDEEEDEEEPDVRDIAKAVAKDRPKKRYEKILELAIDDARNNSQRSPIKLFGVVFGPATLWCGALLLGTNIYQHGVVLAAPAANTFCDWADGRPLRREDAEGLAAIQLEPLWGIIVETACDSFVDSFVEGKDVGKPARQRLTTMAEQASKLAAPPAKAETKHEQVAGRRLASGANGANAPLPAAVLAWWTRHVELSTEVKLTLLQDMVRERELEAHRLLLAAPRAVYEAALLLWGPQ